MINTNKKLIELLTAHLGLEPDDITLEDSFTVDLHMNGADLSDFAHTLSDAGYSISPDEISNFETVGELVEFLNQEANL
jgi:acyl carrier protein